MGIQYFPWLSIIFCYCYWIYLSVDITLVSCHIVEDQQSLLKLKNNLKFKPGNSSKLLSWQTNTSYCKWIGVTCDKEGHVNGLDLSGESIYGGFDNSSSIFSLLNLKSLNLATNNFNSVIPSGFSKLKNLTDLNLSYAGFEGQIPTEIFHLTRLVTLDISSFSFLNGKPLKLENLELEKLFHNLTRIRKLYLDGVSITAQGYEWSNALLLLPNLQELSMSNCSLSGPLDPSLATLKKLSIIRLDQNNLSSSVPETFASFPNLTNLHLGSCGLTGLFPKKIFQVATLSVIDLSFNNNLHGSFPEFPLHGSLQTLIVTNTSFSGALPDSISNLRPLSILDLSRCQFNRTLPSSMSRLTELTYLDLSSNNFHGLIPSLNASKNIFHLDPSHNSLAGSVTSVHLDGLGKLVKIDLQNNLLNGTIPSSLFTLPLLQSFQLSNNNFEGQLDEFAGISPSMLVTLDLSNNNLEGPIPTSVFHLRSLSVLKLSSNKLNGTLKLDVIQGLANLTTLDLSHNNLSVDANVMEVLVSSFPMNMSTIKLASCNLKRFPSFLRNQSKINTLDLSSNHIQGSIPRWIWQLDYLDQLNLSHNLLSNLERPVRSPGSNVSFLVLDLHSNKFQGQLPIFPMKAAYLDYSSNNFSSFIPSDISTHLTGTIFLSLSKNNLHGTIPQSLCNTTSLLVLDVSYNQFNGTIPECLTQIETLVVLNLQHNWLHSNIPDIFLESCALKTLDLNGNQLGGPIPKSLMNCTSLEVLDLGNNQISDVFPCFLKKLTTLRVMVLRKNSFHGRIGCPHTNETWKSLQIVDLAFNSFNDSLPASCFRTWEAMMLDEDYHAPKFNHIGSWVLKFDPTIYYHDSVTLNIKGLQLEFVKILNILTSVDFSSNKFQGPIPEELMNFTRLSFLNLSQNALIGQIPSSIGNLKRLESLDLSSNYFDGEIPTKLASLSFLSYMNLSFNHLMGKVPEGTQLQTFEAGSYAGNEGLCGPPLKKRCRNVNKSTEEVQLHAYSGGKFDFTFVSTGVGFGFGAGMVVAPCMFSERVKNWSNHNIHKILLVIFPLFGLTYTPVDDEEPEEDTEENKSDMEEEDDCNEEEDSLSYQRFRGRYCVSCSKLDMSRKKVIHDPRCTCYHSPTVSTYTFPESHSS